VQNHLNNSDVPDFSGATVSDSMHRSGILGQENGYPNVIDILESFKEKR